jgi:lysophospholipase L1-like esterase
MQLQPGYQGELKADLAAIGGTVLNGKFYNSWTFPGFTSGDLNTLMHNCDPVPSVDAVLTMSGTNDVFKRYATAAQMETDRNTLLLTIHGQYPNAKVFVSPIPLLSTDRADAATLNPLIQQTNANTGWYIAHQTQIGTWSNVFWTGDWGPNDWPASRFQYPNGWPIPWDGVHPNADGLAFLSQRFIAAIQAHP